MPPKKSAVKATKQVRRTWRDVNDATHRTFTSRPNPESLHPDADTVIAAVSGSRTARALTDSYAFRFPVTVVADLEVLL